LGEGDIATMSLHLSMNPGEYSYFSPRTLSMWAGPEHWRFRPRRRPDTGSERESRQRNPRKVFELDFEEDVDFEPHFRKTKASTTLAKSILESQNVRSTTLPADFHYDPENMVQLFLKAVVKLSRSSEPPGALDSEAGIGDYDYNNPGDTHNFCPALQDPDSDDDPDPGEFQGEAGEFNLSAHPEAPEHPGINGIVNGIGSGGDITTYGEMNLIAEPQKVGKFAVQYARSARRMDMRRLKRNMWELLAGAGPEPGAGGEVRRDPGKGNSRWELRGPGFSSECRRAPQRLGFPEQGAGAGEGPDAAAVAGEKVLSDLTKELLHRLPPTMATNLSVPLAFVCLLHLANEKNLRLESTEDLSDILVRQGD
ncbi:CND2 protein, partial [Machaerirhynchus nigripectus]|nr:CND2 protein [Machaerirhynchus nigripectus]